MELKQYKELRRDVLTHFKSVRYDHFVKNTKLIPDLPGVYLIYRFNDGHPYIGESNNVRRRLLEHATVKMPTQYIDRQIKKEGLEGYQVAFILKAEDYSYRRKMEGKYVDILNSYRNGFNGSSDGGSRSHFYRFIRDIRRKILKSLAPNFYKRRNKRLKVRGVMKLLKLKRKLVRLNK